MSWMPTGKRALQRHLIKTVFEGYWRFRHIVKSVCELARKLEGIEGQ
jgi:hypothetical protein